VQQQAWCCEGYPAQGCGVAVVIPDYSVVIDHNAELFVVGVLIIFVIFRTFARMLGHFFWR
jgi:hypothetical protein